MGEVLKFVTLDGGLRKKNVCVFCKNDSILRPFLVKFRFECPALSSANPDSHFIWLGSGTDLVRSGNKAGFRSGLKLANVQPDLNPVKTRGSMQS